ncbi:LysE type translocator [compost metagenome]
MSILMIVFVGLVSAIPVGPSLYEVFRQALDGKAFPLKSLGAYLFADLFQLVLAFGVYQILADIPWLQQGLYLITAVFMGAAAVGLMRKKSEGIERNLVKSNPGYSARKVFFLALFNPAILLFYISLVSTFSSNLTLSVLVFLMSFLFFLVLLLGVVPKLIQGTGFRLIWLDRFAAVAFAGIALKFLFLI